MGIKSPPLSLLLDLSSVENSALISQRFTEISEALLHSHYLRIDHAGTTTDFELLEVEFYLKKQDDHEDPFCHAHQDQQKSGQWYFHRAPQRNGSLIKYAVNPTASQGYRGGTRKGLDLTFGSPIPSSFFSSKPPVPCRGGILLRSMRLHDRTGEVISGPSLLVDKILSITGSRSISELIETKLGGDLSALPLSGDSQARNSHQSRIYFICRPSDSGKSLPPIHRSPRVGLDLSHQSVSPQASNPRVVYIVKLYRYFIRPDLLKANGRCHTLIGLCLESVLDTSTPFDKSKLSGPLARSMNINPTTVERYVDDFAEGFKNGSLIKYTGRSGKGISSNPRLFMRLMGVLGRMGLLMAPGQC